MAQTNLVTKRKTQNTPNEIRLPPQAVDVEESLLGALLIDERAITKVIDAVRPQDFYRPEHQIIFQTMLALFERNIPLDVVTLTEELERTKKIKEVGGVSAIAQLPNKVPTASHATSYASIVHEKGVLRRLISAGTNIIDLGYQEDRPLEEIVDEAEKELFLVSETSMRQEFEPIKEILVRSFERIDDLHKHRGKTRGVPTGFDDLDNILSGLQESDLIILASRPSMGKTSLALNIAQYAALQHKLPVGFFSLEQSKDQLVDRLIAGEAGVDAWKLRTGNLANEDFERLNFSMGQLAEAPIFIDDTPNMTVMEVRSKARRLQAEHGLKLVIVDYLQLMKGRETHDGNRVQEISEISRGLKGLARELNVPVLALSQLSRAVEQRPNKIPQLSDLRESGSIEQDADVVMFIYREDYYDPQTENKNIAQILIKKHRNGPIGEIELYFVPQQTKYFNLDKKRE